MNRRAFLGLLGVEIGSALCPPSLVAAMEAVTPRVEPFLWFNGVPMVILGDCPPNTIFLVSRTYWPKTEVQAC